MSEIDPKLAKKYATDLRMIATYHGIEGNISGVILNAAADMLEQFVHAKSQAEAEIANLKQELAYIGDGDTVSMSKRMLELFADRRASDQRLAAERARSAKLVEVIQQAAHEVETAKRGFANIGMQNICLNEADLILHQALAVYEWSKP